MLNEPETARKNWISSKVDDEMIEHPNTPHNETIEKTNN